MLIGKMLFRKRAEERQLEIDRVIIAGWTARDESATTEHVRELGELGVAAPATIPQFYRLSRELITTQPSIEVVGGESSGEVEAVILTQGDEWWVTVGSDHTDRALERVSVAKSKQACSKPIAPIFWAFSEVAAHWDELQLRCFIVQGDNRTLYQDGTLDATLRPEHLLRELGRRNAKALSERAAVFCGTQPVIGGIRPAERFELELYDPVLKREIRHRYDVNVLPDVG